LLQGFRERLFNQTYTADKPAGLISREWTSRLGLSEHVVVGVGAFDAHMGAVGGQIEPYHLSKIMGTSTCDILVVPREKIQEKLIKGICGQVDGSVIPGMVGLEAGQSAFGDTFAWLRDILSWPTKTLLMRSSLIDTQLAGRLHDELASALIPEISRLASGIPLDANDPLAIDWLNGRRTPDANQELKGAMLGLNLGTSAPHLFKAWVEATCFGAKAIVDRFNREGVPIKGLIGLGGVARKSPYIMQVMANVMSMPIRIHRSEQTCALGAAMFAATAAGLYDRVEDAMIKMGQGFERTYVPESATTDLYARRYQKYLEAGTFLENLNEKITIKEHQL
jgi:L-ribulokinase